MVAFLDEYSRYIVHHEILLSMDGLSVSMAAQKAIETLPKGPDGKPSATPEIRSDNGSCYISKEFRVVLTENGLGHHRIQPALPRGERPDGACQPDVAGGPGGRGGAEQPAGGAVGDGSDRAALQRGATAQRVGLSAARGVLPGRPGEATSRNVASSCRRPGIIAGSGICSCVKAPYHSKGGSRYFRLTPVCATTVETLQPTKLLISIPAVA